MTPQRRVIFGHRGFGDAMVMNGMVRHFAKDGKPLEVFGGEACWRDVRRMYADTPNVNVWWVTDYGPLPKIERARWAGQERDATILGFFAPESALFSKDRWDSDFYRIAGVPFDVKWAGFHLPTTILGPRPPAKNSRLVHDDPARGFNIRDNLVQGPGVVEVVPTKSIWDWMPELRAAAEIHVIDSVFLNLADLMACKGWLQARRLVYHKYARPAAPPTLRANWEVIQ